MRFLSIAAFAGLAAATHVAANKLEARDAHLDSRTYGNANCDPGKGYMNGRCQDCSSGQFSRGGQYAQCQTCPSGSTSSTCESSCVCKPGFYIGGGKTYTNACNPCSAGYTSNAGASGCSPCPANTYSTQGGTCQSCPAGYTSSP
ncbi:hypothetical protein FS749_013036, partial [Ceratobasidium sp. UAMH 11750]